MKGRSKVSDLVPRLGDALDALRSDQGRVPRDVVRAVQREYGRGLIQTARVEARAHVARVALVNTALLSADEASFIQMAPLGEARYKAIVDAYAIYAASEVGRR